MSDVVELARTRRAEIRAEIEALNRFVVTAERLLRSAGQPIRIVAAEPNGPARIGQSTPGSLQNPLAIRAAGDNPLLTPVQMVAQSRDSHLQPEWMRDTFDFEQTATGAA